MDVLTTYDKNVKPKVVVAHQPNFMPWAGFFYKMTYADCFIILDQVQFTKGGYTNRVKIRQCNKAAWLTVPVTIPNSQSAINEIVIRPESFLRKHLNTLRQNYARSEYLTPILDLISDAYYAKHERLVDLNLHLLKSMTAYAGIKCDFILQSELATEGKNNDMLANLASQLSASIYVAGQGARSYTEGHEHVYHSRGIRVGYHKFSIQPYKQAQGEFVPGCSLIDAMFNLGPDICEILSLQQDPPFDISSPLSEAA